MDFVVMAAVPPAIAVLPLTRLLNGDVRLSLYSEALCYLASLVLMPAIIFCLHQPEWRQPELSGPDRIVAHTSARAGITIPPASASGCR